MNNKIWINCPDCGIKLQIPDIEHIEAICRVCNCEIEVKNGRIYSYKKEDENWEKKISFIKTHRKKIYTIVGIIIAFIIFWNVYLDDYLTYKKVVKSKEIYDCEDYLNDFPNGYYYDEIYDLYDDLSFDEAKENSFDTTFLGKCDCSLIDSYIYKFTKKGKHFHEAQTLLEKCNYENAKISKDLNLISSFIKKYPESKFIPELTELKNEIIHEAQTLLEKCNYENAKISKDLVLISSFIKKYPQSKFIPEITGIKNEIFDGIIYRYDSISKNTKCNKKAVSFFKSVLLYLKETLDLNIYVKFNKQLDLKDWDDYSKEIRKVCDSFEYPGTYTGMKKPSESPPPSLKAYFVKVNIEYLENIIINKIKLSFKSIFNNSFLSVKKLMSDKINTELLLVTIDYKIKNLDCELEVPEVPELYIHYSRPSIDNFSQDIDTESIESILYKLKKLRGDHKLTGNQFIGYILGISIDWKFNKQILNSDKNYQFNDYSRPKDIKDIHNISDAYSKMTEQSFINFADSISNNFGINLKNKEQE